MASRPRRARVGAPSRKHRHSARAADILTHFLRGLGFFHLKVVRQADTALRRHYLGENRYGDLRRRAAADIDARGSMKPRQLPAGQVELLQALAPCLRRDPSAST